MKLRFLLTSCLALSAAAPLLAQDRTVLPIPPAPFDGVVAENILDAKLPTNQSLRAPQGAPNVLLFMADDVGFAMSSAFGGPVPTPNFDRLAANGQRYNRFHTTGICSPTRAALLTGRNNHNMGVGHLSDTPTGFPGYTGAIGPQTATIAQVLRLNGYSTAMFGKHHNLPNGDDSAAGPFDFWPTSLGFEYFFGIVAGDSDQYNPNLYRGTNRVDPDEGKGRMLEQRLADDIISWVHNQKAAAPEKPFFAYYAPGSTHAPHQAPQEHITRFHGQFDQGWDKVREDSFKRQIKAGIIPKGTKLTPRPAQIPAWDSLTAQEKAFAIRTMEVAAAQLAYQDEQFGLVIAELERMGLSDSTLIMAIQGDNGASGEAGPHGTVNELQHINGLKEAPEWLAANVQKLGGPMTYQNYPVGWAWAMNAPLRWVKQNPSMLGAIRNGMIASWHGKIAQTGTVCGEFGHVVDIAPTIYQAVGIPAPTLVNGVAQKPVDGQSLLPSLAACAPDKPRTQYFELSGMRGLYHDGWFASRDTGRMAWEKVPPGGPRATGEWELYDLRRDFSQNTNVAAANPAKMQELAEIWQREATRNNVFPMDTRFGGARTLIRPEMRKRYDFWGKDISLTALRSPVWVGRSYTIEADLAPDKADASGVVMAVGSHFAGFSLFLDQGRPVFVYARSTQPDQIFKIASDKPFVPGNGLLRLRFDSEGPFKGGKVTILQGENAMAAGQIGETFLSPSGLTETLDIGRDIGVSVTDYRTPHGNLEGDVRRVSILFDR
ncbi:arylsulfatase [Novosphingobium sp. AAP83]|uniref:arylsulfatase n=1 Tax=Novosphingobium sp. AAP83 TaxID=1523425 RepID=UPI0006B9CCAE|nr:arylsulfatase [Novosphingobium sp. AAP83]KPF91873.1 arylsulfatase [Novosphingobium sp. AAP83]